MNNEEIVELRDAIDNINADLYNQCIVTNKWGKDDCDPWIWMELHYGIGGSVVVKFLDEYLYNSENDEREFNEDKNEYEPIEAFLRRRANILISKLQKVKL